MSPNVRQAAAVFLLAAALLWWLAGDRLVLTNDEGIYLSHAARIAEGETLYRDLFALTGPASFWLLALAFRLAGVTLAAAHAVLVLQLALLTTLVFLAARRLAAPAPAAIASFIFLALNAADPAMLTNNHRWDSCLYAVAGVLLIWHARPFPGGLLLALAVWATPTLAITALTALFAARLLGQPLLPIAAGGAAGALAGLAALFATHSLQPFWQSLLWASSNYSEANRMAYGAIIGGYSALFQGADGPFDLALRAAIVIGLTLPAWLPPLASTIAVHSRRRELLFLSACGLSMIAASAPRLDVAHLIFAAPLFYAVAASALHRARWTILPVGALAGVFLFSAVLQRLSTVPVATPVGIVRTDPASAQLLNWLTARVQPGESFFSFPYVPIANFVTRSRTVSRFSFLQPGLFTESDEQLAIDDLLRHPPAKILFKDAPKVEYLRIWPASNPQRLELRLLHRFVLTHYQQAAQHGNLLLYTPATRASNAPQ
jgi:hypothetical protein